MTFTVGPIDFRTLGQPNGPAQLDGSAGLSSLSITATGGTIARTLAARIGEVANVKDFGALIDGATDDVIAIQAAMTYAAAHGLIVYLPPGTAMISTNLTWPSGLLGMIGAGNRASIIKRMASGVGVNQMLTITNKAGFLVADLGFDGNKTNNTLAGQGVVLSGCSDYQLRNVRCINHKAASGFGGGIALASGPATNTTGLTQEVLNCECIGNDGPGISIGTSGASISIHGGTFSSNGTAGISVSGGATPVINTIPDLTIIGTRCEHNATGMQLLGFSVLGLGSVYTYGHGNDPIVGPVISGNQVNYNTGYGLFAQVTGGKITGNTCRWNGSTTHAGICSTSEGTVVSNNVCENNINWGIDSGGSLNSETIGNICRFNGTGINMGANINTRTSHNLLQDNSSFGVHISRNDSGQFWFPWDASNNTISNNTIINTISPSTTGGIGCSGNCEDTYIENNRFVWPDTTGYTCITPLMLRGRIFGNAMAGNVGSSVLFNAAANLVPPDWADMVLINTDTTPINNVTYRTLNVNGGIVSGVKLSNRGSGYATAPTVTPTGTWSVPPTFAAHLSQDGRVAAVEVLTGGSGVVLAGLTIAFSGGGGTGAAGAVEVGQQGITGRICMLLAYSSQFRIASASTLHISAPAGATVTFPIGSVATIMVSGNQTAIVSQALSDGSVYPTNITMPGLPAATSFANDTAAASGGVAVGQFYRNGSIIQVRVS